jgi:hypothetical protein
MRQTTPLYPSWGSSKSNASRCRVSVTAIEAERLQLKSANQLANKIAEEAFYSRHWRHLKRQIVRITFGRIHTSSKINPFQENS